MLLLTLPIQAQREDIVISFDGAQTKNFGGFILDMGTMLNAETLTLPMPNLLPPSMLAPLSTYNNTFTINHDALDFNKKIIYSTTTSQNFTPGRGFMYPGMTGTTIQWQSATYKLNNSLRIITYGEYDADGRKVHNPHAKPWQKNNFNAGFEMKSSNGSFGIKLEVHGGRNNPF